MPRYDFRCEDGHTAEHITDRDTRSIECSACGRPAARQLSLGVGVGVGARPAMRDRPVDLDTFIEAQNTVVDSYARAGEEAPDFWSIAKRESQAIRKARPDLVTGS
tara:strand:+ start:1208 stop:1525 length:318 start_codon:yes stop_codon:yes gene_type:complete